MNRRTGRRRGAKQRRGVRIVLWFLGLFVLTQLLGGLALDYLWIGARDPHRADMMAELHGCERPPEIVFLGSSRFGSAVCCDVLDEELHRELGDEAPRTFNAALPGGDPTQFERVFEMLRDEGYRPQLLVVEISPEIVSNRDILLQEQAMRLLEWRDVPEAVPALLHNGHILSLVRARLLPLHLHRYQIGKEILAGATALFQGGAIHRDRAPPPSTLERQALLKQGYELGRRALDDYHVGGLSAQRLERLLERCQTEGVPVVLLGVPTSSALRRAYTPGVEAAFQSYMQQLTERYGCSFRDWRDRVPDAYFLDCVHMHASGGIYFSRRFAPEVLAPWWRERPG